MGMVERIFDLNELKEKKEAGYAYFISSEDYWEFLTEKEKTKRQVRDFWDNIDLILDECDDDDFDIVKKLKEWIESDDLYISLENEICELEALEELADSSVDAE